MIRARIKVCGWTVSVFMAVTRYNVGEIVRALEEAHCNGTLIQSAADNITTETRNNGVTYSNPRSRRAVVVIGYCDAAGQYFNTIVHEITHLTTHIARYEGIDPNGEGFCYLAGDIASKMYKAAKEVVCPCCLKEVRNGR